VARVRDIARRRARLAAAQALHRAVRYAADLGAVGPHDPMARRFAEMGEGSCIGFPPGVVFGERFIRIGRGTLVCAHVTLAVGMGPDEPLDVPGGIVVDIGDRCVIGRGVSIVARRSVVIEDDVTTAPDIYITDHNHSYSDLEIPIGRQWMSEAPVRIGAGSWIGTRVVVLPGTDIGRHVTVAGGSVVRGTIPDHSVVAGVPAKVIRRYVPGRGWDPPITDPVETPDWFV
jgi:acetyltransferase-like isoleucine patch superfamily enzyme